MTSRHSQLFKALLLLSSLFLCSLSSCSFLFDLTRGDLLPCSSFFAFSCLSFFSSLFSLRFCDPLSLPLLGLRSLTFLPILILSLHPLLFVFFLFSLLSAFLLLFFLFSSLSAHFLPFLFQTLLSLILSASLICSSSLSDLHLSGDTPIHNPHQVMHVMLPLFIH